MTKTEPETLRDVRVFEHQARVIHGVVRLNTDGLTQEDSLVQPEPAGNCLNWVVGHLVATNERLLKALGQSPVMEEGALDRYARGSAPLTDPDEALELEELLEAWDAGLKSLVSGLRSLDSETLAGPAPFSPGNDPDETLGSLISLTLFHQAYHAGQTGLLRRIAGKDGAIP